MIEWLQSQDWNPEFWAGVWFAVIVLLGLAAGFYGSHLGR
jgi:hypothetical protein